MTNKKSDHPSRKASEGRGKKEASSSSRRFGVIEEKISRTEFLILEKRVAALEKSRK